MRKKFCVLGLMVVCIVVSACGAESQSSSESSIDELQEESDVDESVYTDCYYEDLKSFTEITGIELFSEDEFAGNYISYQYYIDDNANGQASIAKWEEYAIEYGFQKYAESSIYDDYELNNQIMLISSDYISDSVIHYEVILPNSHVEQLSQNLEKKDLNGKYQNDTSDWLYMYIKDGKVALEVNNDDPNYDDIELVEYSLETGRKTYQVKDDWAYNHYTIYSYIDGHIIMDCGANEKFQTFAGAYTKIEDIAIQ